MSNSKLSFLHFCVSRNIPPSSPSIRSCSLLLKVGTCSRPCPLHAVPQRLVVPQQHLRLLVVATLPSTRLRRPAVLVEVLDYPSSTKVSKETIMARRKTRRDSNASMNRNAKQPSPKSVPTQDSGDKENDEGNNVAVANLLQSPTPCWKVAQERGISPPETRSIKKSKKQPSNEDSNNTGGGTLLVFSPPDQVANARREKEQLERKEKERCVSNRNSMIVFLPTTRSLC